MWALGSGPRGVLPSKRRDSGVIAAPGRAAMRDGQNEHDCRSNCAMTRSIRLIFIKVLSVRNDNEIAYEARFRS
jgi:hypothetical protein